MVSARWPDASPPRRRPPRLQGCGGARNHCVTCRARARQRVGQRPAGGQRRCAIGSSCSTSVGCVTREPSQSRCESAPHPHLRAARSPCSMRTRPTTRSSQRPGRIPAQGTGREVATAPAAPDAEADSPRADACATANAPSECATTPCQGPRVADAVNSARTHCGKVARAPSLAPWAGKSSRTEVKPGVDQRFAQRSICWASPAQPCVSRDAPSADRVGALPAHDVTAFKAVALTSPRRRHRQHPRAAIAPRA